MIIDYTYFTGVLSIGLTPDIAGAASYTQMAERERIESYIEVYESEYLRKVLGESVYKKFMAYISSHDEENLLFDALHTVMVDRYSPIACYIYFKLLLVGNYHITSVGAVSAAGKDVVPPMRRQIAVWNDMVAMNKRIYDLLKDDKEYAPEMTMFEPINEMSI